MSSNIFIVGANGQLGTALRQKYPEARYADTAELDITDKQAVGNFDWSGIDTLINSAAYTNVDGAETLEGRRLAWAVNADAVANLVAVAAQHNMTIVHISTDYVFDGTENIHNEDEAFSPLSVYGASKSAGDLVVSLAPKFYILRTSWVIGEGKNFVRTMLELGKKGINPTVVSDQIGRLTFTSELVRAINHLLSSNPNYGTYNVTNSGVSTSWAEITREIYKLSGLDNTVTDISTADYFKNKENVAPRPLKSTLSLDKIQSTGFESKNWTEDLTEYLQK
ncbi:NAD(P)-dependent oxidoreductase [Candidatus Saccharibacteria bacterium]|nr:NAD(P)-dependent oxidoreductase [Candidatus Saccharibacteria bacterium]